MTPRTEYLQIGKVTAPPAVADALRLKAGASVLVRRRRLFADDEPTQLADSYYPWAVAKGSALLKEDAGTGGSYGRLAGLGHAPVRFTEDVTLGVADDDEAAALDLDGHPPVFRIAHTAWTADGTPVEIALHVMPGHVWALRYEWEDPDDDDDQPPAGEPS